MSSRARRTLLWCLGSILGLALVFGCLAPWHVVRFFQGPTSRVGWDHASGEQVPENFRYLVFPRDGATCFRDIDCTQPAGVLKRALLNEWQEYPLETVAFRNFKDLDTPQYVPRAMLTAEPPQEAALLAAMKELSQVKRWGTTAHATLIAPGRWEVRVMKQGEHYGPQTDEYVYEVFEGEVLPRRWILHR